MHPLVGRDLARLGLGPFRRSRPTHPHRKENGAEGQGETVQQCFCDGWCWPARNDRPTGGGDSGVDGRAKYSFHTGGQNDLLTVDPIVWLSSYSDYLAGFRAAIASSRKVVKMGISTHNPRDDAQFNAHRAIADQALRLFPSEGKCDFVVDWAVDQTWGPDSAASNQTLYPDGTHPSQAGQANMEAKYLRPVLNSLFNSLT